MVNQDAQPDKKNGPSVTQNGEEAEEKGYTTYSYEVERAYEKYLRDEEGGEEAFLQALDAQRASKRVL